MGELLDGKILAKRIKDFLKEEVGNLQKAIGKVPVLKNILIGGEHGSCAYANSQKRIAEYIGIKYELRSLSDDVTQDELIDIIVELNNDVNVNGIMIHKPVPLQINYRTGERV